MPKNKPVTVGVGVGKKHQGRGEEITPSRSPNLSPQWENIAPALENAATDPVLGLTGPPGPPINQIWLVTSLLKTLQGKPYKQKTKTKPNGKTPSKALNCQDKVYIPFSGSQVPFWLFPNSSHANCSHLFTWVAPLPSFRPYTLRCSLCLQWSLPPTPISSSKLHSNHQITA